MTTAMRSNEKHDPKISAGSEWTADEIQALVELWRSDEVSRSEIAEILGRSISSVSVQASRLGLGPRKRKTEILLASIPCNICGNLFHPATKFVRFCPACRGGEEVSSGGHWIVVNFSGGFC